MGQKLGALFCPFKVTKILLVKFALSKNHAPPVPRLPAASSQNLPKRFWSILVKTNKILVFYTQPFFRVRLDSRPISGLKKKKTESLKPKL